MADLTILGLELRCDGTSKTKEQGRKVLSKVVLVQDALHAAYGGVLADVMRARGLAAASGKPLVGSFPLAAHELAPRRVQDLAFPHVMHLVLRGHRQVFLVDDTDRFQRLGRMVDDAPGEAFDEPAQLFGPAQPGGRPHVKKAALRGDASRSPFLRWLLGGSGRDMSCAGVNSALLRARRNCRQGGQSDHGRSHGLLCRALASVPEVTGFAVAGRVAANPSLRAGFLAVAKARGVPFTARALKLCTDNAAMIARAVQKRYRLGYRDDRSLSTCPRWPLAVGATTLHWGTKLGAKA